MDELDEANTVPSDSLEQDIDETLDRLYNRAVTHIQIKHRDKVENALNQASLDVQYYLCSSVGVVAEPSQIADGLDRWIEDERRKVYATIEQLKRLLAYRKAQWNKLAQDHPRT